MTPRTILDALGLPGSAVPSSTRSEMTCVTSDVILEAEMVAFSDVTGGIDGKSRAYFPRFSVVDFFIQSSGEFGVSSRVLLWVRGTKSVRLTNRHR